MSVPDTELFSAYLDGELTAEEQAHVEQLLSASPDARQLLEELRALGSTLQGLPQQKPDEDLSVRVLELAERRMLLPDPTDDAAGAKPSAKPSAGRAAEASHPEANEIGFLGIPWREISWRGMLSRRALTWSAIVVATALVISLSSPPPKVARQDIARLEEPEKKSGSAPTPAVDSRRKSALGNASWDAPAGATRALASEEKRASELRRKEGDAKDRAKGDEGLLAENDNYDRKQAEKSELPKIAGAAKDREVISDAMKPSGVLSKADPSSAGESENTSPKAAAGAKAAKDSPPRSLGRFESAQVESAKVVTARDKSARVESAPKDRIKDAAEELKESAAKSIAESKLELPAAMPPAPPTPPASPMPLPAPMRPATPAAPALHGSDSFAAPAKAPAPTTPSPTLAENETRPQEPAKPAAVGSPPAGAMADQPVVAKSAVVPSPTLSKRGPENGIPQNVEIANGSQRGRWMDSSKGTGDDNTSSQRSDGDRRRVIGLVASTVYHLRVSPLAVKNNDFERLLEQNGLVSREKLSDKKAPGQTGSGQSVRGQSGPGQSELSQSGPGQNALGASQEASTYYLADQKDQQNGYYYSPATPAAGVQGKLATGNIAQGNIGQEKISQGNMAQRKISQGDLAQGTLSAKAQVEDRINPDYASQQPSNSIIYACDVSPQQLATIVQQIHSKSDSFSDLNKERPAPAAPSGGSLAAGNGFGFGTTVAGGGISADGTARGGAAAGAGRGGSGGMGGGGLGGRSPQRQVEQQQVLPEAPSSLPAEAVAQSATVSSRNSAATPLQSDLAAGASARQHVVFVLDVVDPRAADVPGYKDPASAAPMPSAAPAAQVSPAAAPAAPAPSPAK
jgi:hypothetical protein